MYVKRNGSVFIYQVEPLEKSKGRDISKFQGRDSGYKVQAMVFNFIPCLISSPTMPLPAPMSRTLRSSGYISVVSSTSRTFSQTVSGELLKKFS
jgi:hypothetical protein